MSTVSINHPDRLFPAGPELRRIAIDLYESVCDLPIVSPHGHTDPAWFALDERFPDAVDLDVTERLARAFVEIATALARAESP